MSAMDASLLDPAGQDPSDWPWCTGASIPTMPANPPSLFRVTLSPLPYERLLEARPRSDIDLVVVGNAELLALSEALYSTEQALGRAIHLSLYEPAEWRELRANDPVMRQIDQGPKLQLLPDAQTA